jgi:hypothetical protein
MSQYVCKECREGIEPDASACPHCGFRPVGGRNIIGVVCIILGGLLTLTLVGAIVGLPMMLLGFWLNRTNRATPAVEA